MSWKDKTCEGYHDDYQPCKKCQKRLLVEEIREDGLCQACAQWKEKKDASIE